jgi:hypothetical protein
VQRHRRAAHPEDRRHRVTEDLLDDERAAVAEDGEVDDPAGAGGERLEVRHGHRAQPAQPRVHAPEGEHLRPDAEPLLVVLEHLVLDELPADPVQRGLRHPGPLPQLGEGERPAARRAGLEDAEHAVRDGRPALSPRVTHDTIIAHRAFR